MIRRAPPSLCVECSTECIRDEIYDAYFCPKCEAWRETQCGDPTCEFCVGRPDKPLSKARAAQEWAARVSAMARREYEWYLEIRSDRAARAAETFQQSAADYYRWARKQVTRR